MQGKAHYHAIWSNSGALAGYRGLRKLDNYYKKVVVTDIAMRNDNDIPPEEKEQWLLDREAVTDAQEQHTKFERVIEVRDDNEGNPECYIKCKRGLDAVMLTLSLTSHRARSKL